MLFAVALDREKTNNGFFIPQPLIVESLWIHSRATDGDKRSDFLERVMEMNWSKWFRCESSFSLLLVPGQPGVFALAEEVAQPMAQSGTQARRLLAVFEAGETDDLVRALSRLFAPSSPWSERLAATRCYVRYAVVPDRQERSAAATALKNWLNSQRETGAQIFEQPWPRAAVESGPAGKTVAERAVDRVTGARGPAKAVPAG
ncbi:MAG TPA: hypothetical protein VJ723_05900 [Candidatus Angelobacter sp.]|nr:hypothetical protein [Candidatus Angelobacter sp.]